MDIVGETSSNYTAGADDVNQYLRARASYEDRRGSNKTASAVLTTRVGEIRPDANAAPAFAEATASRTVSAGTTAGRNVGAPIRVTDADQGEVLTYSLSGQDAELFDIDPATGQIRTRDVLDIEVKDTYTVTVSVHDGFDGAYIPSEASDATIEVAITVTAVPVVRPPRPRPPSIQPPVDGGGSGGGGSGGGGSGGGGSGGGGSVVVVITVAAPEFAEGFQTSRALPQTAQSGDAVGSPVAATHSLNSAITYSLSGADAASFTVDAETGQIRVGPGLELEVGETYTVDLTATDSSGAQAVITVAIEVSEGVSTPYDQNSDGIIQKDEVLAAVSDYFAEVIEKGEVLKLILLYFSR